MGRLPLRHFIVGLRLDGMDEIREFDGVLNEKDGRVVAHQVIVAFLGIELGGEAADVPHRIRRSSEALHVGKTHKDRGLFSRILQKARLGVLGKGLVYLKIAMCPGTSCVNHAFRYPLLVKMSHFFQKVEVFKQRGPLLPALSVFWSLAILTPRLLVSGWSMPLERMVSRSLIFSVVLSGIFMEPGAEGSALGGVGFGVGLISSGSIVSV